MVAMLSGGRDSVCLLDVAVALCEPGDVSALHVNYGLREQADADERHCARSATSWASSSRCVRERRPPRARRRQRALRATCRRGRARCATRAAARIAERARRADRDRPHRQRPGRDDPLPAGRLARAGARCWGWSRREGRLIRPLLGPHARADGRLLRSARPAVARGREQRRRALRAHARAPRARAGAARGASGGRGERAADRALLREETELLDGLVGRRARAGARASRSRASAQLPAALARLVVVRLAEAGRRQPTCPRRATAWRRSSRSAAAAAGPSCTSAGRRAR